MNILSNVIKLFVYDVLGISLKNCCSEFKVNYEILFGPWAIILKQAVNKVKFKFAVKQFQ